MLCDTLRSIFFGLPTVVPLRGLLAQLSCIFLLQLFVFFYYADCCTQRMCLPQHIAAAAVVHLFVITRMIGNNSQGPLLSWEDEAGELFVLGAEVAAACCWWCLVLRVAVFLQCCVVYLYDLPAVPTSVRPALGEVSCIFCYVICFLTAAVGCCTANVRCLDFTGTDRKYQHMSSSSRLVVAAWSLLAFPINPNTFHIVPQGINLVIAMHYSINTLIPLNGHTHVFNNQPCVTPPP